jgi:two-component system sensor histidine kinase UhpB
LTDRVISGPADGGADIFAAIASGVRSMTLRTQLVALVAGALLISLAAGVILIAVVASHWVKVEIDADAQMARQLVEARLTEEAEEAESADRIVELMQSLEARHHLHARYLEDGAETSQTPDEDDIASESTAPSWLFSLLGVRPSVEEIPVSVKGKSAGKIVIATNPSTEISKIWQLIRIGVLAIVVVSASTLALVMAGLARSLRPLGNLAGALSRIGGGDYSARIGTTGPTEIALLGRHFDRMAEQLQSMQKHTRSLTTQLLAVQERERRDIARDLHDELGPCLLAANLDVSALIRLNQNQQRDELEECAQGLSRVLDQMQGLVRRMIGRLHLESAEPFDLGAAVADLTGFWRERCPEIAWHVAPWDRWPELSPAQAVPLHRIVQEAVSNAVRHSGARNVSIDCIREQDATIVRVSDDGSGIGDHAGTGFGLSGMRDRIEALGGSLDIASTTGQGTIVAARLPVARPTSPDEHGAEPSNIGLETV